MPRKLGAKTSLPRGDSNLLIKFLNADFNIPQNGSNKPGTDYFARMNRNCGDSSIRMSEEHMAAACPHDSKAKFFEDSNDLFAFESRQSGHTEIC